MHADLTRATSAASHPLLDCLDLVLNSMFGFDLTIVKQVDLSLAESIFHPSATSHSTASRVNIHAVLQISRTQGSRDILPDFLHILFKRLNSGHSERH